MSKNEKRDMIRHRVETVVTRVIIQAPNPSQLVANSTGLASSIQEQRKFTIFYVIHNANLKPHWFIILIYHCVQAE